jgi:hypothetical protein
VATVRRTRFMRIYEPRWTTTERRCGPLLSTVGAKLRLSRGTRMTNDDWRDDIVVEPPDHMPYSDALEWTPVEMARVIPKKRIDPMPFKYGDIVTPIVANPKMNGRPTPTMPGDRCRVYDRGDHFFAYRAPDGSNWDGYAPDFELVERNPDGNP